MRAIVSGLVGVLDEGLLRSTIDGLREVMEKPLKYSELPRLLTGISMVQQPVSPELIDQLVCQLLATDAHNGVSTALADSIIFSHLTPSNAVRTRLRKMKTVDAAKNIYPTRIDFATLSQRPEATLKAIEAQQLASVNQDEMVFTSAIAKRVATIGRALGMDSRNPESIAKMVGLLSALGSANRQLDRISQKRRRKDSDSDDEI